MWIDLNADLGETIAARSVGDDAALLEVVTSANVACGFHAGDPETMARTVALAAGRGGRRRPHQLPLVRGAVQLPPPGRPLIFGPDHPSTGGYPVVAVLSEESSDLLAQCRPGDSVILTWAL